MTTSSTIASGQNIRTTWALWGWILLFMYYWGSVAVKAGSAGSGVCHTSAQLPSSLLNVIAELEDQGCDTFVTACLLTSQGVTRAHRSHLLKNLFSIENEEDVVTKSSTAIGTASHGGLVLALSPSSLSELDATTEACAGTVFYYASADDLSRGEGLFHTLGPVMERLAASIKTQQQSTESSGETNKATATTPNLVVLCDGYNNGNSISKTKLQLERAALSLLSNLIARSKKLTSIYDIFDSVQYVDVQNAEQLSQAIAAIQRRESDQVAQSITAPKGLSSSLWDGTSAAVVSSTDLAAARRLGPAARSALSAAIATVREAMSSSGEDSSSVQLVSEFGKLCDAAIQRAVDELDRLASSSTAISSSSVGKQIRANLRQELHAELGDLFEQQLEVLQTASFEQFRKDLSQLRVSAILAHDMEQAITKSLTAFAKAAQKLQSKHSAWSTWPAKLEFRRRIREYSRDRLLAARASGQYRPVPRKGINFGFHWLFPKPFGNDFRQEPWMVHATDNMVYVPKDKITDVTPEEVRAGDWRRKVVPSPAGNDIIYLP